MALTLGTGPFGPHPGGVFNFEVQAPKHILYIERSPRRLRVMVGGETVADSRRVRLLHETGVAPIAYFPRDDVRDDLLEATDRHTRCPFKGEASYCSVRVGDRLAENAMWFYPEPIAGAAEIAGHVAFYWDRVDEWWEEDQRIHGHLRDPYHRIDVLPTDRHVRVSLDGELLAESRRALVLFESNLRPRYYLPEDDLRREALVGSEHSSVCPYKGQASYASVRVGDVAADELLWTYREPLNDAVPVLGHWCFYDEKVDLELDGERQERTGSAPAPSAAPAH